MMSCYMKFKALTFILVIHRKRYKMQHYVWSHSSHNSALWNLKLSSDISQQSPILCPASFASTVCTCPLSTLLPLLHKRKSFSLE